MSTQEGQPVIVKGIERQLDDDRLFGDLLDPIRAPQGRQLTALAEGHVALVARGDGGIDRDGFVPEHTKHLHAVAIVPDRG